MEKLRAYLLACHTVMGVPVKAELAISSIYLKAEKARKSKDLNNMLRILQEDNVLNDEKKKLPWAYRTSLLDEDTLQPIKEQIRILNFVRQSISGGTESIKYPSHYHRITNRLVQNSRIGPETYTILV